MDVSSLTFLGTIAHILGPIYLSECFPKVTVLNLGIPGLDWYTYWYTGLNMLTADYFTCLFALGAKKGSTGIPFHAKEIRH